MVAQSDNIPQLCVGPKNQTNRSPDTALAILVTLLQQPSFDIQTFMHI